MNLFQQQAANRRKSQWLVVVFVLFFAWLGFGGDFIAWQYTLGAPEGVYRHTVPWFGVALSAIAIGLVRYIRRTGAQKVLWSAGAWELVSADTEHHRRLENVVEEMAIAAGVPRPTIHIIDDPDPNAFVTGTDVLKSHLAVTSGLIEMLDRDELQGVVAHEMGHVKNLDMQLMTMVAGLAGAIALIADGSLRVLRHGRLLGRAGGGGSGGKGGKNAGPLLAVLLVVWLISWMLAPLITRLLTLAISRKREYLADAMAAQFTRNPVSLASALDKIEKAGAPTHRIRGGVAHLCIADPLGRRMSAKAGLLGDLFATHPPMALRVARLRAMAFQAEKRGGDLPPE